MPNLPYFRRGPMARVAVTLVALASVAVAGQASFSSSSGGYVVQPGDSLWRIAQRSGTSVQALAAANHMQLTDILLIGRHLAIPGQTTTASYSSSSPAGATVSPSSTGSGHTSSTFCNTFTPTAGTRGALPSQLAASPSRLSLRPLFVKWGSAYGVQPALLEAIAWQESGWQQGVVSSAKAVGIGQLLPSTASFVGRQLLGQSLDINSSSDNIRMMARFVAYLQSQVSGTCNVVASYYEGPQNLAAYGVFAETQPYVANVEYLISSFQ